MTSFAIFRAETERDHEGIVVPSHFRPIRFGSPTESVHLGPIQRIQLRIESQVLLATFRPTVVMSDSPSDDPPTLTLRLT